MVKMEIKKNTTMTTLCGGREETKKEIRQTFIREGAGRKRDHKELENFYYATIYEIINKTTDNKQTSIALKRIKAQIVRLHNKELQSIFLDNNEQERINEEEPTIYHIIKAKKKRQKARIITHIIDKHGMEQTNTYEILRTFTEYMRNKFEQIPINETSFREIVKQSQSHTTTEENEDLENPITENELLQAIRKGKPNKAPGCDGISQSFFNITWPIIKQDILDMINQQYTHGTTTAKQKQGIIVCIPKTTRPSQPSDFRPLTLLNSDIKILARVIANRLTPILTKILSPNQHCGIQNNSILQAVTTVRDAIAYAEHTNMPMCVLTLDFKEAFDNIAHEYIYKLLKQYGFTDKFQKRIQQLHSEATSVIRINGQTSARIPIKSSVRQGCPLSVQLYALCMDPLIRTLENTLTGIQIGRNGRKTTVTAYADDVTIFVTSQNDIPILEEALRHYTAATGAKLNINKSVAMAIGPWDTRMNILNVPYHNKAKILGTYFHNTITQSTITSWTAITQKLQARARETYNRNLSLTNRLTYVQKILMAQIWYNA
jgi:hypothetical protein